MQLTFIYSGSTVAHRGTGNASSRTYVSSVFWGQALHLSATMHLFHKAMFLSSISVYAYTHPETFNWPLSSPPWVNCTVGLPS